MSTMRLFTAIDLPGPARRHLADVQARMKELWRPGGATRLPPVSWTRENNLHVTLKFLGEVPDDRLPEVCEALARAEFPARPLRLHAAALDAFPSRGSIRVLHARVEGDTDALAAVHASVEARCGAIGFPRENRRFRAHVTMGRPRMPLRATWEALEQATEGRWPGPVFEAPHFSLVQSRLNPAGSIYTTLATFPRAVNGL